ncbi:MAG: CopD family protein [Oligoflexus sp.]
MMLYYREILAIHVIAIISWMAGILYLYRLLIYATEKRAEHEKIESLLQLMSFRLWKYITLPAMIIAWVAGLTMLFINTSLWSMIWMQIKLVSVVLLTASTIYAAYLVKIFNRGQNLPAGKTLRFLNEVPTLFMVIIVVMVIVRPWV